MNTIKLVTLTLAIGVIAGCESQLDQAPISDLGSNNFYRNTEDFTKALSGVYAQLAAYPDRHFILSDIRSDNIYGVGEAGVREHEPVNNFSTNLATNPLISEAWNANFTGIMRANTVLDQLELVGDVIPDENLKNRIAAETRFLRAFFYFDLVRWFGKVPLFDTFKSPTEALEIPRSPVAEVYELILSDLDFAVQNLDDSYTGANLGRVTSWAAKAMLARVYLTRSGPDYGIEGPGMDTGEYEEALTLLNDVINNGPHSWVADFPSIFSYDNENNPDIVLDIQYQSGGLGTGATYPGTMAPSPYFDAAGIPMPAGLEIKPVSQDLLSAYSEDDVRRAQTIHEGYTDVNGNYEPRPFFRKFLNEERYGLDRFDWGINFPLIRFTDVLMMKAEAILHGASGSQAEVDQVVNQVRQRAGLAAVSGVDLDMLLEERRREFAAEGLRWHDLVRSGKVLEVMNAWLSVEDVRDQMADQMTADFIIYPVPQDQMDVKQGLYQQNPGY